MLQGAQASEPEIAFGGRPAHSRDQKLSLGRCVGIGTERRYRLADGAGIPYDIGTWTGSQQLIQKTLMVLRPAISVQAGVQDGICFLGVHARLAHEKTA